MYAPGSVHLQTAFNRENRLFLVILSPLKADEESQNEILRHHLRRFLRMTVYTRK